jgi:hypothetical protein
MTRLVDNLELRAAVFSRNRIRAGLRYLKRRGLPVDWFERRGWWRSVFPVWGHPAVIRRLRQRLARYVVRPAARRGRNLDIVV